jgi:hypothetical protein
LRRKGGLTTSLVERTLRAAARRRGAQPA